MTSVPEYCENFVCYESVSSTALGKLHILCHRKYHIGTTDAQQQNMSTEDAWKTHNNSTKHPITISWTEELSHNLLHMHQVLPLQSFMATPMYTFHFYARRHICCSAYMLSPVRLSVTRVDQSKTVEVRIMQFAPYDSTISLVFVV